MSDKKTWGSTVMGWFVVKDDQPFGGAVEEDAGAASDA